MEWQICMGFMFLCVISVIMYGAAQGWYSKKIKTQETVVQNENCDAYKEEIERLKGKIFEQALELDAKTAKLAEMTKQLDELMNSINELTTRLQDAEEKNAKLAASLKNALEDLQRTRMQLQECSAKLLARRIVHDKCNLTPETANLIR